MNTVAATTVVTTMDADAAKCGVCGAEDAARHYGSVCCRGCKGFFRRSVRSRMLYKCPREGCCPMEKKYRNCCRACRLKKCFAAGMDPRLVQNEWGKSATTTAVTTSSKTVAPPEATAPSSSSVGHNSNNNKLEAYQQNNNLKKNSMDYLAMLPTHHNRMLNMNSSSLALGLTNVVPRFIDGNSHSMARFLVSVERFCDLFVDSPLGAPFREVAKCPQRMLPEANMEVPVELAWRQPAKIIARFPIGLSEPSFVTQLGLFARAYCRLMVLYFDWASHFAELEQLSEQDRKLLLTGRAMQCLWLLLSFRSAQLPLLDGFAVSCDMFYPRDMEAQRQLVPELCGSALLGSINQALAELVRPFRQMGVSAEEYALLRAICLFSPVAQMSPEGQRLIGSARNKYLQALAEIVQQQQKQKQHGAPGQQQCGYGITTTSSVSQCPEAMAASSSSAQCPEGMMMPLLLQRMNSLLMFLGAVERINQQGGSTFSAFSAFGTGGMRGSFTYELHLR